MKAIVHDSVTGISTTVDYADETISESDYWATLRTERNSRLGQTDIYALVDNTLTDDMKTYRQALRDLPSTTSDPQNPIWPTKPS
tara:strand:- start:7 stop:261 length:255 start_codon:yes stop_codon:yes gene_type:complete